MVTVKREDLTEEGRDLIENRGLPVHIIEDSDDEVVEPELPKFGGGGGDDSEDEELGEEGDSEFNDDDDKDDDEDEDEDGDAVMSKAQMERAFDAHERKVERVRGASSTSPMPPQAAKPKVCSAAALPPLVANAYRRLTDASQQ